MFKNPFNKRINDVISNNDQKKSKLAEEKRAEEMLDVNNLDAEDLDKVKHMENTINALFDDKQELRSVYERIKDYFPESDKKIAPEMLWENLHEEIDSQGNKKKRSDEEIIELIAEIADKTIRKKIISEKHLLTGEPSSSSSDRDKFSRVVEVKEYEIEMTDVYKNFLRFQTLAENIKLRDTYYARIKQYQVAKDKKEREVIWNDLPQELKEVAKYKGFVLREFVSAKKKASDLKSEIEAQEYIIDKYQSAGARSDLIRLSYKNLSQTLKKYESLLKDSPELYYYESSQRLQEYKNTIDSQGNIIETPYVKSKLALIKSFGNRPVFIHGELGSGKTELAKHACRTDYSEEYLKNIWEKDNPRPSDKDELEEWYQSRKDAAEALIISGHKNIDVSEFFGSKEMKAEESLPPKELASLIEKTIVQTKKEREEKGEKLSPEEEKDIRDIYKESFKSPIEIKTIMGLFYRAMKDGRPIILDEINAIPHTALIAINDLLTLKTGSKVTPLIPGIPEFKVAKGFRVFATGNWKPEDGKAYFGRQGLDAAFLSRFAIISYDYLPQRVIGSSEVIDSSDSQKEREESELFDIMISSLLDDNLCLDLPVGSIKKLSALASVSRVIQNIFSEKKEGDIEFDWRLANKKIKQRDVLKENVLSIRHLIPIIQNWKKDGFRHELEEYILKDYIERSQHSRNSEKLLIYRLMQNTHGGVLFNENNDWPSSMGIEGEEAVINLSTDNRLFSYHKTTGQLDSESVIDDNIEIEHLSTRKVIELLFGKFPERKNISNKIFENKQDSQIEPDLDNLRDNEEAKDSLEDSFNRFNTAGFEKDKTDEAIINNIKNVLSL